MKILFTLALFLLVHFVDAQNLSLIFIGNSITIGKGGTNGFPPPTHAVNYLREQKGVEDIQFANLGKSGSTTVDWLPGSKLNAKVIKAADTLFAKKDHQLIFSIKLGTNDSAIQGPNGAPVSKENYGKNMQTIISELLGKYPGSKVVVHHPIWYSENTYNSSKYLKEGLERNCGLNAKRAARPKFARPELRVPNYASRTTRSELRVPNYASRTTRSELRVPNYASRTTRSELRVPNYAFRTTRPEPTVFKTDLK